MNYSNLAQISEVIDAVFDLYKNYGEQDYIGEEVTQLQHALQCGHLAHEEYPDNKEIILGAFLHDVGHMFGFHTKDLESTGVTPVFNNYINVDVVVDHLGAHNHEQLGSQFLQKMGFTNLICSIPLNHVNAKRYLVSIDENYYNNLSEASKQTLVQQGGLMSSEDIEKFKNDPNKDLYIKMRHWDDAAKSTSFEYKYNLDYFRELATQLLNP